MAFVVGVSILLDAGRPGVGLGAFIAGAKAIPGTAIGEGLEVLGIERVLGAFHCGCVDARVRRKFLLLR